MAFVKTDAGRNACASGGWLAACAGGKIKVYTAAHALLLGTWQLPTPAYSGPVAGLLTGLGVPITATPAANGAAAVYDITQANDTVLGSGSVTATGGGGDMVLNNVNLVTTADVNLNSYSHQEPTN